MANQPVKEFVLIESCTLTSLYTQLSYNPPTKHSPEDTTHGTFFTSKSPAAVVVVVDHHHRIASIVGLLWFELRFTILLVAAATFCRLYRVRVPSVYFL